MKNQSNKFSIRKRKLKEVFDKMDKNWDGMCCGCGKSRAISHSHIIPVSEARELESDIENITFHCIECHKKHESHNINVMSELLDFEKNMNYIKRVRPLYYNRLTLK